MREIAIMEVLYPHCAGLDVHKDTVVAALRLASGGQPKTEIALSTPPRLGCWRSPTGLPSTTAPMSQHRAILFIAAMQREECLDVSIAMRLNFIGTALGWGMTTQLWHEVPLGRPPQQPTLRPTPAPVP